MLLDQRNHGNQLSHQNILNKSIRKKNFIFKATKIYGHLNAASSFMCPPIITLFCSDVSSLKEANIADPVALC